MSDEQKLLRGFWLCMIIGGLGALVAMFAISHDYGQLAKQVIDNLPDYTWYSQNR